ncbi:OPA3-like protein [Olea europaea var. sylvestris]|uniref:OPA3-like protein n=1 Tax=Olea europaea var. sylvestris TaxID=158386 RepID=UPI000C1CF98D|nr:OPA3-like protein [Olea europaea var. sylvestris]
MILPVFKLGTLALKTLCKPIGKRIKKKAGLNPKFRQSIINIAQANHRFRTTVQRHIYGQATDVAIRPLNEEKAVQAAADLLGELFVFSVLLSL